MVKDDLTLSVVIPARNEFPNVVHTMYSIWHAWEADGFNPDDMEIIIVDNCTKWAKDGTSYEKPAEKGTTTYAMPRGGFWARKFRVLYDPIAGNHSARNKGAEIARGKYVFFSDGHMAYRPGFFKHMMKATEESGGIVHAPIAWMGAYPPEYKNGETHGIGYQYTIKLGEEIKGTWAKRCLTRDDWFYIPALGHCSLMVNRKQFLEFGGYPKIHRSYGGGEFYLNMKWWMFGSSVAVEPRAIGYHLSAPRGYTWYHDDYIENVLGMAYALGMDDWRERAYLNWLRKGRKEKLDEIMKRNEVEHKKDRKFIEKKRKHTFNELLLDGPKWERLNIEKFGKSNCGLQIFHPSWLELMKSSPAEKEYPGKYQEELNKFIVENFWENVYKNNKYKKEDYLP